MRDPYAKPRITAAMVRRPSIVASRQEAYERFRDSIRRAVPEYSELELMTRAQVWTDAAIAKGAVVVRDDDVLGGGH